MKNKVKLSEIRQNELQKDEMHSLAGGALPSCSIACSCTCECSLSSQPNKDNDMTAKQISYKINSQEVHQSNNIGKATGSLHF